MLFLLPTLNPWPKLVDMENRLVVAKEEEGLGIWGLDQGQARRTDGSCSKHPNSPMVFGGEFLIGRTRERAAGYGTLL